MMSDSTKPTTTATAMAQEECESESVQGTPCVAPERSRDDEPSTTHDTARPQCKRAREEDAPVQDAAQLTSGHTSIAVESEASPRASDACTTPSSSQPHDKPHSPTAETAVAATTDTEPPARASETQDAACMTEIQDSACDEAEVADAGTPPPPPRSPSLGAEPAKCSADADAPCMVAADAEPTTMC